MTSHAKLGRPGKKRSPKTCPSWYSANSFRNWSGHCEARTAPPADIDRTYLNDVRQAALILLYRLLFVVYAEDRDLLPDQKSLTNRTHLRRCALTSRNASKKQAFSSSMLSYWPKLSAVFKAIADGNDTLGIPPYNGGLFSREAPHCLIGSSFPTTSSQPSFMACLIVRRMARPVISTTATSPSSNSGQSTSALSNTNSALKRLGHCPYRRYRSP